MITLVAAVTFTPVPMLVDRRVQIEGHALIDGDVTIIPRGALVVLGNLTVAPRAKLTLQDGGGFQPIYVSEIAQLNDARITFFYNYSVTRSLTSHQVLIADGGTPTTFGVTSAQDTNACSSLAAITYTQGNSIWANVSSDLITCPATTTVTVARTTSTATTAPPAASSASIHGIAAITVAIAVAAALV